MSPNSQAKSPLAQLEAIPSTQSHFTPEGQYYNWLQTTHVQEGEVLLNELNFLLRQGYPSS